MKATSLLYFSGDAMIMSSGTLDLQRKSQTAAQTQKLNRR